MINKKTFSSLLLLFFLISCKTKDDGYYLKGKWKTIALPYASLRSQPKKVIEYFYKGIEDINLKSLPRHGSYESFTYNRSGDLTEYAFHLSNSSLSLIRSIYTNDGYKQVMTDQNTHGLDEKPFKDLVKNSDGSYKETAWYGTGGNKWATVRFTEKGNKIVKEETMDGTKFTNSNTITSEYDDQRLLKETIETRVDNVKTVSVRALYYSKEKWLDSMVLTDWQNVTRTYFVNNDHGDPIREMTLQNNDTMAFYVRQYLYDQKNNWVRMLEKQEMGDKRFESMPQYILISREIFY